MSGGHYDYAYSRINQLATDIRADIIRRTEATSRLFDLTLEPLPKDILAHMQILAQYLDKAGEAARDIEWFLSGDYGEETLRSCPSWKLSEETRNKDAAQRAYLEGYKITLQTQFECTDYYFLTHPDKFPLWMKLEDYERLMA